MGLVILEQFFKRNFELTHRIFQNFLFQMSDIKFTEEFNPQIYDNVLSATGLLPLIYKTNRNKNPELVEK